MNISGPVASLPYPACWAVFEPGEPPQQRHDGPGPQRQAHNDNIEGRARSGYLPAN